jgi:hypothetical protein
MHVVRHQHVGVQPEVVIVGRGIQAVVKVQVILLLEKNCLPFAAAQNYMLRLIDDTVAR